MSERRLIAVWGGGAPDDMSCDLLSIPKSVDIDEARETRNAWYKCEYIPDYRTGKRPEYMSFPEFLIARYGAREATSEEILQVSDY